MLMTMMLTMTKIFHFWALSSRIPLSKVCQNSRLGAAALCSQTCRETPTLLITTRYVFNRKSLQCQEQCCRRCGGCCSLPQHGAEMFCTLQHLIRFQTPWELVLHRTVLSCSSIAAATVLFAGRLSDFNSLSRSKVRTHKHTPPTRVF